MFARKITNTHTSRQAPTPHMYTPIHTHTHHMPTCSHAYARTGVFGGGCVHPQTNACTNKCMHSRIRVCTDSTRTHMFRPSPGHFQPLPQRRGLVLLLLQGSPQGVDLRHQLLRGELFCGGGGGPPPRTCNTNRQPEWHSRRRSTQKSP